MADSEIDRDLVGTLIFLVVRSGPELLFGAEAEAGAAAATVKHASAVLSIVYMPPERLPLTFSRGFFMLHWPLLNMVVKPSLSNCEIESSDILNVGVWRASAQYPWNTVILP